MRRWIAAALVATGLLVARGLSADEPRATIRLEPPETLGVGDRAAVVADVRIASEQAEPLLLTPSTEGTAVEVVRGRLLRSDAAQPEAETLRFRIPIVARTRGTGVLRVAVSGYSCGVRCRRATAQASVVLRVERGEPAPATD